MESECLNVKSLPNCHVVDVTLRTLFSWRFISFKRRRQCCLVAGQFCEGGVHLISQRLVSVLVDAQFVLAWQTWREEEAADRKTFNKKLLKRWQRKVDKTQQKKTEDAPKIFVKQKFGFFCFGSSFLILSFCFEKIIFLVACEFSEGWVQVIGNGLVFLLLTEQMVFKPVNLLLELLHSLLGVFCAGLGLL